MKTIAIMNVKGGVGKTMTACNMAHILAKDYRQRVLLLDADPQGDASEFFGAGSVGAGMTELHAAVGGDLPVVELLCLGFQAEESDPVFICPRPCAL